MVFEYEGWTLYRRVVKKTYGETETIYFFSKRTPHEGVVCDLPEYYKVKVMKRTGLPYLEKE